MKTGYWILIIYLLIAVYIMYARSQSFPCKRNSLVGAATQGNSRSCDTWKDIILPGLTLGLYQNKPDVVVINQIQSVAQLTNEQKCGPLPRIVGSGAYACLPTVDGAWSWQDTGGANPSGGGEGNQQSVERIFGIRR